MQGVLVAYKSQKVRLEDLAACNVKAGQNVPALWRVKKRKRLTGQIWKPHFKRGERAAEPLLDRVHNQAVETKAFIALDCL